MSLMLLALVTSTSYAKCELQFLPNGVWFNSCPVGSLAEAVDVRTQVNSPFTNVWVRCVRPKIICSSKKK
jgi:hypothetical protein